MTVKVGNTGLSAIYQGESLILKIYKGETLVWYYNHEEGWYYWEEDSSAPQSTTSIDGGSVEISHLLNALYEELDE